ncbi:MAG: hypothetical protein JXA20_18250 [Spirochaetes bacterium]|nr:hypothetical protein [Spirochaetota bacterium]
MVTGADFRDPGGTHFAGARSWWGWNRAGVILFRPVIREGMMNEHRAIYGAVAALVAALAIKAGICFAMPLPQGASRPKGPVGNLGTMLRFDEENRLYSLDVPVFCVSLVPASEYVQLNARYYMMFGVRRFFFDPMGGIVVSVYPFRRILNLHVSYDFSFAVYALNYYTHIISGGVDLDFPLAGSVSLYAGIDIYTRRVFRLLGYRENDYYYRSRSGCTLQMGVRFCAGGAAPEGQ